MKINTALALLNILLFFHASILPNKKIESPTKALHHHHEIFPFQGMKVPSTFGLALCSSSHNALLIGCHDGSIIKWNLTDNKTNFLKCSFSPISSILRYSGEISINNTKVSNPIIAGNNAGNIIILSPCCTQILKSCKMHDDKISSLVELPSGLLMSGSHDKTIKAWSPIDNTPLFTLKGHTDWINSIAALPKNKLASGSDDGQIKIWDLESQSCQTTLTGDPQSVNHILYIPPEEIIASNNNGTIRRWNISTLSGSLGDQYHEQAIRKTIISQHGYILTSSDDQTIILARNCENHQRRIRLSGHTGTIFDMIEIEGMPGIIASCSKDQYIFLWRTPEELATKNNEAPSKN